MADNWKDQVTEKLVSIYGSNTESLLRVMWILTEDDKACGGPQTPPPMWKALKDALNSETGFKTCADRFLQNTKTPEWDPKFCAVMRQIHDRMMAASESQLQNNLQLQIALISDETASVIGTSTGLARSWALIPAPRRAAAVEAIKKIGTNYTTLSTLDKFAGGADIVMVGLASVALSYACIQNILRWRRGEITGKRCAQNCLDSLASLGAGVGGGLAGAAIGTLICPLWGTLIGGIFGGVLGAKLVKSLFRKLTKHLFDLPVEEATERAYNFFGVHHRAPNDQVNRAFRKKCLATHPDKGGKAKDFMLVQFHMAVIRAARGEMM